MTQQPITVYPAAIIAELRGLAWVAVPLDTCQISGVVAFGARRLR